MTSEKFIPGLPGLERPRKGMGLKREWHLALVENVYKQRLLAFENELNAQLQELPPGTTKWGHDIMEGFDHRPKPDENGNYGRIHYYAPFIYRVADVRGLLDFKLYDNVIIGETEEEAGDFKIVATRFPFYNRLHFAYTMPSPTSRNVIAIDYPQPKHLQEALIELQDPTSERNQMLSAQTDILIRSFFLTTGTPPRYVNLSLK